MVYIISNLLNYYKRITMFREQIISETFSGVSNNSSIDNDNSKSNILFDNTKLDINNELTETKGAQTAITLDEILTSDTIEL